MDGVPELTQPAIEPGDSFTYRFPVNDSGTFWYHAHFETWKQISKGLYGPLVVKNNLDKQFDKFKDELLKKLERGKNNDNVKDTTTE